MKFKSVWVDGFWKDTKKKFKGYECRIGDDTGIEDDDHIFFYFSSEKNIANFTTESKGVEFVITKYYFTRNNGYNNIQ